MNNADNHPESTPAWVPVAGAAFGALTFIFFITLIILSMFEFSVPDDARFYIIVVLSVGISLSFAFYGSDAAAKGKLPVPFLNAKPIEFSVAGGIAVFVVVMLLGHLIYLKSPADPAPGRNNDHLPHQSEFVNLKVITKDLPPGVIITVQDQDGEHLGGASTGAEEDHLFIRIPVRYLGEELTVHVSSVGFAAQAENITVSQDTTLLDLGLVESEL